MPADRHDEVTTVAAVGEAALLERLRARVPAPPSWVPIGIGDDAAVIEPARGELDVLTTDSLIEGVHFRRDWSAPEAIGHKALAVNLSDLAAMGAAPRAALLGLALPPDLPLRDFDALIEGFLACAAGARVPLVGGNLAASPGPLIVDVTVLGAARRRRVLTRAGGRAGDGLYVTGSIGGAAVGLGLERAGVRNGLSAALEDCARRYHRPDARLRWGVTAARCRAASACVDLSDGLADAVHQLARAAGLGAVVNKAALPLHPGVREFLAVGPTVPAAGTVKSGVAPPPGDPQVADPVALAIAGGEDYELLFAVRTRRRRAFEALARAIKDVPVSRIGRLSAEPGCWLEEDDGRLTPLGTGFAHF